MAKKIFTYRGKTLEELQSMGLNELSQLLTSDARRVIKRGFTDAEKKLLKNIRAEKRNIETHCRDMLILPEMVGMSIKVYSGKVFVPVLIDIEMIGHRLGEFVLTRNRVAHSAPGVGATRSSSALSVR
ncbi:30S ribosomal protein S19 [Candidatus Woesearchaeota archaeon CG11_big_fil_rev_8_21_14_0_20_43_8]|nr:MAG: 30S ribosomal protein S19 [Candidatus Woesearchaeota archaeon CG11_big_fil_rev_8_21_14_0_20_43_8]PIO05280.1 MAG: 30S ribosomal protein S19 [Candidatus Woesearchaeota archaeon CG08_land_8_20_14_0_20_43_7]